MNRDAFPPASLAQSVRTASAVAVEPPPDPFFWRLATYLPGPHDTPLVVAPGGGRSLRRRRPRCSLEPSRTSCCGYRSRCRSCGYRRSRGFSTSFPRIRDSTCSFSCGCVVSRTCGFLRLGRGRGGLPQRRNLACAFSAPSVSLSSSCFLGFFFSSYLPGLP